MDLKSLQANWEEFARHDPMWAILTDPKRTRNRWDPEEFFRSGESEINALVEELGRGGYRFGRQRALDFGCGVGRLTQALCAHFENCVGVDISDSMVAQARKFNRHGERCRYVVNQVNDLSQFAADEFDFIYTNLVLQHIERRYVECYLREFIRVIRPGGLAVFQIPSSSRVGAASKAAPDASTVPPVKSWKDTARGLLRAAGIDPEKLYYWQHTTLPSLPRRARLAAGRLLGRLGVGTNTLYHRGLAEIPAVMEMHCFERTEVEAFLSANGGRILEVKSFDFAGPEYLCYMYYVSK